MALEGEPEADLYYNLACYLAMQFSAAGATDKAQLEESVGLLRKAVELSSNFAEIALKDPDFADVFRQKPEFMQFLREQLGTGERLKREG